MRTRWLFLGLVGCLVGQVQADEPSSAPGAEEWLARAEAFVARSDRYLHQSRLRPGMTGYGLTVMEGMKIEKFDATVLGVLRNVSPRQDVILCRLGGLGLDKSGIIAGMSGSPVFIRDPADGKDKLVGAVAFGWSFQKDPLCGVQPIVQMLAIEQVPLPGARPPASAPASLPAQTALDEEAVRTVLQPAKIDFAAALASPRGRRPVADSPELADKAPYGGRLLPLALPVMITGGGRRAADLAERTFASGGLFPVQAGAGSAPTTLPAGAEKLQPGSAIAVTLYSGDASWTAIGTVTEVIGDYVLALGHAFQGEGPTELPMGPGYVHAVVPSMGRSFKVASGLATTGVLVSDEFTAVGCRIGQKVTWVPMTVTVRDGRGERKYRYDLVRHRLATAALARTLLEDSVRASRDLPENHTLDYSVEIAFAGLPRYRTSNRSSARELDDVASDLVRPLAGLMNAPMGKPAVPEAIDVTVTVQPLRKTATILSLKLEENTYRPGQTVRGRVTLQPYRAERKGVQVALDLPGDLPDGRYLLTACNWTAALEALHQEMPQRFAPKTVEELFQAIQEVAEPKADRLHLRLPLPVGGLAVRKEELDRMPASLAEILLRSAPVDATLYRLSKAAEFPTGYVLTGSAQAEIIVEREPKTL